MSLAKLPGKYSFNTCIYVMFGLAFMTLFVMFAIRTIGDPDFWWHLKTGQLIVENRALPAADPFNFTGDPTVVTLRERVILKGYWLWQVIAYGFFHWFGFKGIKLLGALTLASTYAAIGFSLLRSRIRGAVALPLLGISLFFFQNFYALERPQIVSFLFGAILVSLFVAIRRGERPSLWLYPLMAVWANMHGGVVVGVILLALFAAGSVWDCRQDRTRLRAILLWCLGGVLASLINPNGPGYFLESLRMTNQGLTDWVTEYRSTFWMFVHKTKVIALLWVVAVIHFACLARNWRQSRVTDWLVPGFLVTIGVMYLRNVAFIGVALLPMTALAVEQALPARAEVVRRVEQLTGLAVIFIVTALLAYICVMDWRWRDRGDINTDSVPRTLTEFLEKAPLEGNIFNQYFWGGYLLWELYPQYKLFIDGRGLDEQVFHDYMMITTVSLQDEGGKPEYQSLLEKYQVDYVVMHNQMEFGLVQKLLKYLLADKNWAPIYLDNSGFVLARISEKTRHVLETYRIKKTVFLDRLLGYYNRTLLENPNRADFYLGRGELLGYMGRYDDAERDFAKVQQLAPDQMYLADKMSQLRKLKEKAAAGR